MNLQDFTFLKEDDDSYHVGHPSGKTFAVSKKGMSEKAHSAIKRMQSAQQFVDGGRVLASSEKDNDIEAQRAAYAEKEKEYEAAHRKPTITEEHQLAEAKLKSEQEAKDAAIAANNEKIGQAALANDAQKQDLIRRGLIQSPMTGQNPVETAPPQPTIPPNPGVAGGPSAPQVNPIAQNALMQNDLLTKEQGIQKNLGGLEARAGVAEAKGYQDYLASMAKMKTQNDIMQEYRVRDDAFKKAYMEQKIDPNRVVNQMGTGSKILSAIAIMVGGAGAAASHQDNLAFKALNDTINKDIENQQNDQSKNMNLWKMNRQALGDDMAANLATQNQMLTIAQTKALAAAATIKGPMAKSRADLLVNEIEKQKQANNLQRSLIEMQNGGSSQTGQASQMDPSRLVETLVPKENRKEVYKEIEQRKEAVHLYQSMNKSAEHLASKLFNGALSPNDTASAKKAFAGIVQKLSEGRYNQEAANQIVDSLLPQTTDTAQTVANKDERRLDFFKALAGGSTSAGSNLDLDRYSATSLDLANPKNAPVERHTKDGQIALFDPTTKQFLRFKNQEKK